jgi:hypothetical protein
VLILIAGLTIFAAGAGALVTAVGQKVTDQDRQRLRAAEGQPLERAPTGPALKEIFIGPAPDQKKTDDGDVIACKQRIAGNHGMSWTGEKTGWRTGADPQPGVSGDGTEVDAARTKRWEERMHGIMKEVQNDWLVDCQPSRPVQPPSVVNSVPEIPGQYLFQFGASPTCGGHPDATMLIRSDQTYPPTAIRVEYVIVPDKPAESTVVFSGAVNDSNYEFTATFVIPPESTSLLPGQVAPSQSGGKMTLRGEFDVHDGKTIITQGVLELDGVVLDKPVRCSFPYGATRVGPLG